METFIQAFIAHNFDRNKDEVDEFIYLYKIAIGLFRRKELKVLEAEHLELLYRRFLKHKEKRRRNLERLRQLKAARDRLKSKLDLSLYRNDEIIIILLMNVWLKAMVPEQKSKLATCETLQPTKTFLR